MKINFFNTLSRKEEELKELESGIVKVYSCGPTVYSFPHIGNMRAMVFSDFLKRVLRYFDYDVIDVINITDVGHLVSDGDDGEDKMLKASKKENKNPYEIAKFYEKVFIEDLKKLNILMPKYMPRATDHIDEQLEIIGRLDSNGFVYTTSDGVYFDVSKLKNYGSLSGQSLDDKRAGASGRVNEASMDKRNSQDFALWKFLTGDNVNHIMKWDSKWGLGFPGWHIECSAMGHKYLGKEFDIHTGGIEHIPIHHENEIAQNEGSGVIEKVSFWMHCAHLMVDSEKMSKSIGNIHTVDDLIEKGYDPLAFRLLLFQTHYRKTMNFTFESLDGAQKSLRRINEFLSFYRNYAIVEGIENRVEEIYQENLKKFENSISHDLNIGEGVSFVFEFMNSVNNLENINKFERGTILKFFSEVDRVLGIIKEDVVPDDILDMARKRTLAKENKDYDLADKIRNEIISKGYEIRDDNSSVEGFIIDKVL